MEKRWLSISETAAYIGIHQKTCYVWASKGILPTVKISGVIRIDKRALDWQLESQIKNLENKIENLIGD